MKHPKKSGKSSSQYKNGRFSYVFQACRLYDFLLYSKIPCLLEYEINQYYNAFHE